MAGTPDDLTTTAAPAEPDDDTLPVEQRITVRIPRQRVVRRRRAPVLVAAGVTTVLAAVTGWLPVVAVIALVTHVGGAGASFGDVLRYGSAGWLLAHGVPMNLGSARVSLVPLAVSAFAFWRVARAGVHTTRAIGGRRRGALRPALHATGCVGLIYGLLGAAVAKLIAGGQPHVGVLRAGLTMFVFGLVAAGVGAARESGVAARVGRALPSGVRDALRVAVVATLLVLGAGAAVGGIATAVAASDASATIAAYHSGFAGQAGLTLLCLLYTPNLVGWSAAYLIGPGFTVGAGTTVSAANVVLGPLPAVPVFVGIPGTAVSGAGVLLLVLPLAAAMTAGWLLVRRRLREASGPDLGWRGVFTAGLLGGPIAGALLGVAVRISGGGLGSGRLAYLGPTGWKVALVATAVVALGAVIAGAATYVLVGSKRR